MGTSPAEVKRHPCARVESSALLDSSSTGAQGVTTAKLSCAPKQSAAKSRACYKPNRSLPTRRSLRLIATAHRSQPRPGHRAAVRSHYIRQPADTCRTILARTSTTTAAPGPTGDRATSPPFSDPDARPMRARCAPDAIALSWRLTPTPAGTRDRSTRTTVGALQEITLSERHTRRSSARDAQGAASSAPAAPGVLPTWALPSLDHASRCRVEADISERSDLRLGPHKTIHELPPSDGVHDPIMALWITASDLAAAGRSVSLTK